MSLSAPPRGPRSSGVSHPLRALLLSALLLGAARLPGRAQEGAAPPGRVPGEERPLPPEAERIGEDRYRIGKVEVDLKARTATCAGKVNMRRGVIEYLAVTPGGKLHESVLTIDVRPLHLQVGLILLGLEPKGGLRFQGDQQRPLGSPVAARVAWRRAGRQVSVAAEELVWEIARKRPLQRGAWIFSGSRITEAGFSADEEGSLIATFRDPVALVNNALPGGADDTLYKANERILPAVGTPVTLVLAPAGAGPGREVRR